LLKGGRQLGGFDLSEVAIFEEEEEEEEEAVTVSAPSGCWRRRRIRVLVADGSIVANRQHRDNKATTRRYPPLSRRPWRSC
jgi:hypothetical protein